jgi:5-methylcytosine-specific restriction endonuclease McrA
MQKLCMQCYKPFKGRRERRFCSRACQYASESWKQHIGNSNRGKLLGREDFRKKMSEVTRGEQNARWIKDRSKVKVRRAGVEKYLLDEWRRKVFERDDYTCRMCGSRGGRLNADHIKPVRLFPELVIDLENGRTLCVKCHKETPTYSYRVFRWARADFEEGGCLYSGTSRS